MSSLQNILHSIRLKQLIDNEVAKYQSKHVLKSGGYELIEIRVMPDDQKVLCESEKINGTKCGRPIKNVMVVKDRKGNRLNIGTTCYKQAMYATDANCPRQADYETYKSDLRVKAHCKDTVRNQIAQVKRQLPTIVGASRSIGIPTDERRFLKLFKEGKDDVALKELIDLQRQFTTYQRRNEAKPTDPTYIQRFKSDVKAAITKVEGLRSTLPERFKSEPLAKVIPFNEKLIEYLKAEGFTDVVIKEVFKHYRQPFPKSQVTTMARKTPW